MLTQRIFGSFKLSLADVAVRGWLSLVALVLGLGDNQQTTPLGEGQIEKKKKRKGRQRPESQNGLKVVMERVFLQHRLYKLSRWMDLSPHL
jgi:hypothetical protein